MVGRRPLAHQSGIYSIQREQKAAEFRMKEVMSLNQGKDSAIYELFDDAIVGHFFASTNESHDRYNS